MDGLPVDGLTEFPPIDKPQRPMDGNYFHLSATFSCFLSSVRRTVASSRGTRPSTSSRVTNKPRRHVSLIVSSFVIMYNGLLLHGAGQTNQDDTFRLLSHHLLLLCIITIIRQELSMFRSILHRCITYCSRTFTHILHSSYRCHRYAFP